MNLLNVDTLTELKEKLDIYFKKTDRLEEEINLLEATGRYLAQDIVASTNVPQFARSVVDGFAVKAKDTFGVSDSSPVMLKVTGQVEMGVATDLHVESGEAAYVPTGGMIPKGCDTVIMIEFTEMLDNDTLAIFKASPPNSNIMNVGDDFKEGDLVYKKGHKILAKDIGMLAAMGEPFINVFAKPSVAIISTGDEVISIMEEPAPGQVRDINSYSMAALVKDTGANVGLVALVKDSEEELNKKVSEALLKNNIVLISGGSSAGNKDYTAAVIDSMGKPGVITHGLAMKPGKPTIVGVIKNENCCCHDRSNLVIGLPGHPMAAIVAYKAVVEYFIKKYYFENEEAGPSIEAIITENIHGGEGRETFTFVKLIKDSSGWTAEPIHAKSGSISQLRYADGYIRMSVDSEGVEKGKKVEVILQNI